MIKGYLRQMVSEAARGLGCEVPPESVLLEKPKQPEHGDWATSLALSDLAVAAVW